MIKQFKFEALLFAGLMLVGGAGYSVNAYADTQSDSNQETINAGEFKGSLPDLNQNSDSSNRLNKKFILPGDKEFIPGIASSEKDHQMEANINAEQVQAAQQVQPVEAPVVQAPQETAQQEQATTPSTQNVGTFKISFYDPAVLGSDMGYSGVATNLGVIPRGSKLKITTAQGDVWYRTVNDTGTFAASNPHQIDVAMPNNMIPSYGITSATVEIVG